MRVREADLLPQESWIADRQLFRESLRGCRHASIEGMASAQTILDGLSLRIEPEPEPEPALGGCPLPPVLPGPTASSDLAALLEESKAARTRLATALSPRVRGATSPLPVADDRAVVAAAATTLKKVAEAADGGRDAARPRHISMPITPVSENATDASATAGGDAAFAPDKPRQLSALVDQPSRERSDTEVEAALLLEPKPSSLSVEPECVAPMLQPRRAGGARASVSWPRREPDVQAASELELLRQLDTGPA